MPQQIDYAALAEQARTGRIASGNIDMSTRPRVKNPDGSVSTVRSISANIDGREVLIPTVSDDGRILSNDDAIENYKRTGKHLGMFNSPDQATAYAQQLHESEAAKLDAPQPVDYAALADQARKQAQNDAVLYDPNRRPVSAEDFMQPETQPEGSAVGRFFSNLGDAINPLPLIKGAVSAVTNPGPVDPRDVALGPAAVLGPIVRGAVGAGVAEGKKAVEAAKQGRYVEAAGRGAAALLPLLGPAAAGAGEQIAEGDIAGGLGKGVGLVAPVAVGAVKGIRVPALLKADAQAADALALAERAGVPVDAATATGNKFVKAIQHVSDRSLLGSHIAENAQKAQTAGLATLGEQLASKAGARAVTAGEAGEASQKAVSGNVTAQRAVANEAYTRLREIEADPANTTTFEPSPVTANPDAPFSFTMKGKPTVEDIFPEALKDARANGYTGKVSDLKAKFDERVGQARGLKDAMTDGDEYSHAALLKEIRARGGLRPSDPSFAQGAPTRQLRGEHVAAQQANAKYYGKNAIYRTDGLATDDMLQQLSGDPHWSHIITPDTDLTDLIHRGALKTVEAPGNLEHHLRGVGVQPGATWWREGEQAQQIPMAVDLEPLHDVIRPIAEKLAAKKDVTGALIGAEGQAAALFDSILKGPKIAPLSTADSVLSDLKRMARSNHPDLRNVGQGMAAKALGELHQSVLQTAERAGPDAVSALNEGRTATKAKYAAADVLKRLEGVNRDKSPVTAFRAMTRAGDLNAGHLTDVLAQAPQTKPLIARAVLDGLIEHPTAGAAKTFADWQRLGPKTKALLYTPEHVADIDAFFKLRKMMAENPNPSGTGHTVLNYTKAGLLFTNPLAGGAVHLADAAISGLLHSPRGVKLLTKGMRIPLANKAASAAWASEFAAATSQSGSLARPVPATAGSR